MQRLLIYSLMLMGGVLASFPLMAEPYFAVQSGQKCASCHVSATGGGMRTEFGQIYSLTLSGQPQSERMLDTNLTEHIAMGGDLRTTLRSNDVDQQSSQQQFETERLSLYLAAWLIPQRLTLYLDQQFAPSGDNRAAWMRYQNEDQTRYLRAGKFFLPYGLRLEDDTAFIRQVTGINFSSADNGVEVGWDPGPWSIQLALTNGTAGAVETDNDKQLSLRAVYVTPDWRLGGSFNDNEGQGGERSMMNVFSGANFLGSQWLFELDRIRDRNATETNQQVLFLEMNRQLKPGHVIKLTHEFHDPNTDVDEDERTRNSVVWEYSPIHHLRIRSGLRVSEGIPQKPQDNSDEVFVNLHAYF